MLQGDLLLPPSLHPENGDRKFLQNAGILPHHYTVSTQKTMTFIFIAMKTSNLKIKGVGKEWLGLCLLILGQVMG
jgi:hypothetical protein